MANARRAAKAIPAQASISTLIHALEPRSMFDRAGFVTAFDAGHDASTNHLSANPLPDVTGACPFAVPHPVNEIVSVDTHIADYPSIHNGMGTDIDVTLLDSNRNGLDQEALPGRIGIDATHIVSHGGRRPCV